MRLRQIIASALAAATLAPMTARAEDGHPPDPMHGVVHQRVIALLNPMGAEHTMQVGFRGPLGDQNDILFMGAHAETGLVSYFSPVYMVQGGYVQVSPFSFFVLRAELTHNFVWPIGLSGAGYYGLQGYDDDVSEDALSPELARTAEGWSMRMSATLQGLVPLGPVRILFQDQLMMQYAVLGDASHYYDMKWDLIARRQDWVLINSAVLLLEIDLDATLHLRVGAYDDARFVPQSSYLGHQVGIIAMLGIDRPAPEVGHVTPFVRTGYYTDHVVRRDEFTILGGVDISYDLGAIR